MVLIFPLSHTRVVRATRSRICMYVRAFFFPFSQRCRRPHPLGCLLVMTNILRGFVLFLLPWKWVRRPLVWASGDENEGCFCEFVVSFCGFGCVYAVCCYCLQPFITELKLSLILMKQRFRFTSVFFCDLAVLDLNQTRFILLIHKTLTCNHTQLIKCNLISWWNVS